MSQEDIDSEDVELSIQLAGLSISVRGSPASAASFVRDLASPAQSTARHSFESAASASPATQPDPVRSTLFSSPARTTSSLFPEFRDSALHSASDGKPWQIVSDALILPTAAKKALDES